MLHTKYNNYSCLSTPTGPVPLVVFRIGFGLLMLASTLRVMHNGWVEALYLVPQFHFSYYGFAWVRPLPEPLLSTVFVLIAIAAFGIACGLYYRVCAVVFFLLFTYVELLDKAYYLNHYYFVSLMGLLLIGLPLHRAGSLDALRRPELRAQGIPTWALFALRLQLGLVYVFAGLAKLNPDWLLHALPLRLWLPARSDLPLLGPLFDQLWVAYAMSWAGALYDLTIPFWLLWRRTRLLAYGAVIGFHLMTALLFQIGMFPWIMMVCTLVFFSQEDYQKLIDLSRRLFLRWQQSGRHQQISTALLSVKRGGETRLALSLLVPFFVVQIALPLRSLLYPGNTFWSEEGYRFAWKVMLVEKTGIAIFHLRDEATGAEWIVYPGDYLTVPQEKQMAFQPDMILEFAHELERRLRAEGHGDIAVRAEVYVTMNGRPSQLLIDPTVDLTREQPGLGHKQWILPAPQ